MTETQHLAGILAECGATMPGPAGELAEAYRRQAGAYLDRLLDATRELDELREQMTRLRAITDRRTNEAALTMVAWAIPRARNRHSDEDPPPVGSCDIL